MMNKGPLLLFLLLIPLFAQDAQNSGGQTRETPFEGNSYNIEATGAVEWEKMELSVMITLDLARAGIRLPTGRIQAEEIIRQEYAALMRPYILSLPFDSSSILGDLLEKGEFPFFGPEETAAGAKRNPAVLSPDLSCLTAAYTIDLSALSARFIRHRRPMEMRRVLSPVAAAPYSGIIIIASGELPIHGRNTAALAEPCLFPRIWDTEMNLLYERNMLDTAEGNAPSAIVRYCSEEAIFRPGPSGLSPELETFAGPNPLRIIARGLFGARPTDILIDTADALLILSTEHNRRLLREGKVVIVLSGEVLTKGL
jgi:hypothetical protein